ncbi:hypothetical protein AOQ84DRAFT_68394 [Glonium stellatum]|uniref:Uncharacterized protein n=1 Tax=Glonium stellatum TaxID=574774 RepID=A0A8E2EXT4_9PEZI|nr:hypothetical protein AOQ84DRAFT_68394 [Glonium stellatum]
MRLKRKSCRPRVPVSVRLTICHMRFQQILVVSCMFVAVLSYPSMLDYPWRAAAKETCPMKCLWVRIRLGEARFPLD